MTMPLLHGVLFVVVIGALVLALAIDVMFFADVAATEVAAMTDVPENGVPGFVGFDDDGNFVHYCHCGKWGAFGVGCFLRKGELGKWYCLEHRPTPRSGDARR